MHKLHSLTLHVDGMGAAVHLPDLMQAGDSATLNFAKDISAGFVSPNHVSLISRAVERSLSTFSIAAALDELGASGLAIATTANPGVTLNLQKFDTTTGAASAGSVHRGMTIKGGLIFPRRISVDHQGNAQLEIGVVVRKDGANDPIVLSDVLAIPTLAISPARWTLGPMSIAGYTLADYTSLEIDFGNEVETVGTASGIDDTHLELKTHAPRIMVSGIDPNWFSATGVPMAGKAAAHADTSVILRKRSADGSNSGFIADATLEHVKFTMAGPANVRELFQSSDPQRYGTVSIEVEGMIDASANSPLIIDTTSAI